MQITTVGVDLAKSVFQVHAADAQGRAVQRRKLRRHQVLAYFAQLTPSVVGMEACGSAHYWARELKKLGHEVRLIPAQYVKPYVKTNKTDAADAEAICEAVTRPHMRFVPVKNEDQQTILAVHRARSLEVKFRTALMNQLRGLLGEFGIAVHQGRGPLGRMLRELLDGDVESSVPLTFRNLLRQLYESLLEREDRIEAYEEQIKAWHRTNEASRRIEAIPGVGVLTATALVASVGDAQLFRNGRQMAAWLGLVPRQHSTGGKARLQGISKRGDVYLRTLLIHGARAAVRTQHRRQSGADRWSEALCSRRPMNVAVVARANKTARTVWALLAHERDYDPDFQTRCAAQVQTC